MTVEIICADARDALAAMPEGSAQLVATDPPYNVGIPYDNWDDLMPRDQWWALLEAVFNESFRVLRPGGVIAILAPLVSYRMTATKIKGHNPARHERRRIGPGISISAGIVERLSAAGFLIETEIIVLNADSKGEPIAIGTAIGGSSRPHFRMVARGLHVAFKERSAVPGRNGRWGELTLDYCKNAWLVPPGWRSANNQMVDHPAAWHPEIPRRLIKLFSNEGDLVCDPFLGSGTTAVEAVALGRHFLGCDVSGRYVEFAKRQLWGSIIERDLGPVAVKKMAQGQLSLRGLEVAAS